MVDFDPNKSGIGLENTYNWTSILRYPHGRAARPMHITTFSPQASRRFCHLIDRNRSYLLTGKLKANWGTLSLAVEKAERIIAD
jgi:hypothetical protein